MKNSKVVFAGRVLIDLTGDTVTADKLLEGTTAHSKTGEKITGTMRRVTMTSDGNGNVIIGGVTDDGNGNITVTGMPITVN